MNGDEIRQARERSGWTQQELAERIGVGMRTVGNWERGETVPKNRMAMLEHVLGAAEPTDDPIRLAPDGVLLAELARRAAQRDRGAGTG